MSPHSIFPSKETRPSYPLEFIKKGFYDFLKRMSVHNKNTCYPNLERPIDCLESVQVEKVVVDVKNEK